MNILHFIDSRDIREHLEKIGYQFSTLEAACLVDHSRTAAMQERFDAWEEIIATMPDCARPAAAPKNNIRNQLSCASPGIHRASEENAGTVL